MRIGYALCGGLLLFAGLVTAAEKEGMRLSNFRVPEYNEKNEKKSELIGEEALVRDDGKVDIKNFRLEIFKEGTTNVEMSVTAPQCVYSRGDQIAKSDTSVRIEGDKYIVTGDDFAWDGRREVFKIFKNSKVILQRDPERVELFHTSEPGDNEDE